MKGDIKIKDDEFFISNWEIELRSLGEEAKEFSDQSEHHLNKDFFFAKLTSSNWKLVLVRTTHNKIRLSISLKYRKVKSQQSHKEETTHLDTPKQESSPEFTTKIFFAYTIRMNQAETTHLIYHRIQIVGSDKHRLYLWSGKNVAINLLAVKQAHLAVTE